MPTDLTHVNAATLCAVQTPHTHCTLGRLLLLQQRSATCKLQPPSVPPDTVAAAACCGPRAADVGSPEHLLGPTSCSEPEFTRYTAAAAAVDDSHFAAIRAWMRSRFCRTAASSDSIAARLPKSSARTWECGWQYHRAIVSTQLKERGQPHPDSWFCCH